MKDILNILNILKILIYIGAIASWEGLLAGTSRHAIGLSEQHWGKKIARTIAIGEK